MQAASQASTVVHEGEVGGEGQQVGRCENKDTPVTVGTASRPE